MKTVLIAFFIVVASKVGFASDQYLSISCPNENKISGIFQGLNDNFEFVFKTDDGKIVTFQEIADAVKVDLFDEETIGKRYEITWTEQTVAITDDEGEATGETAFVKRIMTVKQI